MDIRALKTEADYDWALNAIETYFRAEPVPGSPQADRFDILATLIEAYENKHWAIEGADPVETIRQTMAARGLTQAELGRILGSRSRASEVLHKQRALTLDMIRRLSQEWHIPAEALIAPYHLEP